MKQLAALLASATLAAAALADDSTKDMFKKAEKGAGQLFQGMGQEIKKATDPKSKESKKDGKKPEKAKAKDKETTK